MEPEHRVLGTDEDFDLDSMFKATVENKEPIEKNWWELEIYIGMKDKTWFVKEINISKEVAQENWLLEIGNAIENWEDSDNVVFFGIYSYPDNFEDAKI